MKKFSFRLQKLLDLARRREEEARAATARALAWVRVQETALNEAELRVSDAENEIGRALAGERLDIHEIALLQDWKSRATIARDLQAKSLAAAEEDYDRIREHMTECRRELLGLERARDKAREEWQAEVDRSEMNELEEVASFRHQARKAER